jgi:Na+-driven multidrug efflux pump
MKAANKVILNTGILYGRMLLTMGVSLYSTRLVLSALGNTDFGIFNLIAGIIALLSFLNTAMSTSTQRFLSYYQGLKDVVKQKQVFTNSLVLHVIISMLVIGGLEVVGLFLFDGFLNIPADRIESAKTIYHFMSLTVFFVILSVPFNASLISHENMLWVAIVSVFEALLKLGIAYFLLSVNQDKLIIYGILTALVSVVTCLLYAAFCLARYEECTLRGFFNVDKKLLHELGTFAGWNLFGSLCGVTKDQGLAVMLNMFFGTVINAAFGIANQVSGQLIFFSATMLRALNPQIMKSEGAGDRQRMLRISMMASKFGFFLLAIVAIPSIFEMNSIMALWLQNVPDNTVTFCRLVLLGSMVNQLTIGLQSAIQATGKIKRYQSVVGSILLLTLPVSYILLKLGLPAYSVLIAYAVVECLACVSRLYILRANAGLSISEYVQKVFQKELLPVTASVLSCFLVVHYFDFQYRFLITGAFSALTFLICVYFSMEPDEKQILNNLVFRIRKNIKPKLVQPI